MEPLLTAQLQGRTKDSSHLANQTGFETKQTTSTKGSEWTDLKDLSLPVSPNLAPLPAAGSRVPSVDDVLQDGSPQHHGCSQPVPPADIYLPGNGTKCCVDIGEEPASVLQVQG